MITVACVYWKGPWRGREKIFMPEWVGHLKGMVERNMNIRTPWRFVCLSNTDVPCDRIPLTNNWPGWWSKLELFKPGQFEPGRVLYLDLDVLVMRSLQPFFNLPPNLHIVKAFSNAKMGWPYNASVMTWHTGEVEDIYTEFDPAHIIKSLQNKLYRVQGDQEWIAKLRGKRGISTFPVGWVNKWRYLSHLKGLPKTLPTELRIMLCMPKKNTWLAERYPWMREIWTGSQ